MANWFISKNGNESGPFTSKQLKSLAESGRLHELDRIRREDQGAYSHANKIKGLFDVAQSTEKIFPHAANAPEIKNISYEIKPVDPPAAKSGILKKAMPFIAILIAVSGAIRGCSQAGPQLGTLLTFNNGELYYTSEIAAEDARRLGNYLVQQQLFDGNKKTIQITQVNGSYELHVVIKKGLEMDSEVIALMKLLTLQLSTDVFGGSQVDVHLCDDKMNTLRVVVAL